MNCCEDMEDDDKKKCFCGACGGIVVVLIICLAMCWDTVEPLEYGLKCNSVSKQCDVDEVYDGGRYFVGFFNYFINYPSNYQTIHFSAIPGSNAPPLNTRTAEGLALSLSLSFQYKLIKYFLLKLANQLFKRKKIPDLYFLTKQYQETFMRIARDIILQSAGDYPAPAYWTRRDDIKTQMFSALKTELEKVYCELIAFQILNIDLPDNYEDSIVQTQVEQQNKRIKEFEQQATLVRKEINIMYSKMNQQIKEIDANGSAQAYSIQQTAVAQVANLLIDSETSALADIQDVIGLNSEQLNQYLFNLAMMDQSPKFIIGLDNVMISLKEK